MVKKGRRDFYEEEYEMDDDVDVDVGGGSSGKKISRREAYDGYGGGYGACCYLSDLYLAHIHRYETRG
jgi:hypothetical protein